jgi:tRNA(Arg) A34 adenosine deaminase TadA
VDLFSQQNLNHHALVQGGVLAAECGALLSGFFASRR